MQRKNSILGIKMFIQKRNNFKANQKRNNRSAFAMIMAVGIIIIVSTIMIFSLRSTALTSKRTIDLYLYEQAELHTKSAIEYALYDIATNGCKNNISFNYSDGNALDDIYDINISMRYIGTSASGCNDYINNLTTAQQDGSVMMDIVVTVPSDVTGAEPIRFFRRTIQKL